MSLWEYCPTCNQIALPTPGTRVCSRCFSRTGELSSLQKAAPVEPDQPTPPPRRTAFVLPEWQPARSRRRRRRRAESDTQDPVV